MPEFQFTKTLSESDLADIITTAVEGGCNYWAYSDNYLWGSENGPYELGEETYASVTLVDMDTNDVYNVTTETIQMGLQSILNGSVHVGTGIMRYILDDDIDADAADCIVQAGLFGEVVYA